MLPRGRLRTNRVTFPWAHAKFITLVKAHRQARTNSIQVSNADIQLQCLAFTCKWQLYEILFNGGAPVWIEHMTSGILMIEPIKFLVLVLSYVLSAHQSVNCGTNTRSTLISMFEPEHEAWNNYTLFLGRDQKSWKTLALFLLSLWPGFH